MLYQDWAGEMALTVERILEGKQEPSLNPAAEAWLAYLLCVVDRPVFREEIIKKSKSLDIPLPSEGEIDWALDHLKARGWLRISFGFEDSRKGGSRDEFIYRLSPDVKKRLKEIIEDMSVYDDAHGELKDWLSTHPPDSASEETVLAYALYLNESTVSLAKVLEEMDAINVGVPNAHILGAAFLRMQKRGWLVSDGNKAYGLTPEARRFMDTLVQRRTHMGGPDEQLKAWMTANPPTGFEGEPIGDSYTEEMEEWAQVLQARGHLEQKKVKKKRVWSYFSNRFLGK